MPANVGDAVFAYLFQGIGLSSDQEVSARKIIVDAQQAMQSLIPQPPLTELRLLTSGAVLVRPESKIALMAFVSSDGDRDLLEQRIAQENRVVKTAQPLTKP